MEKEESDFELFWKAYPSRKGDRAKQPAKVLFEKAVKSGVPAEQIIGAAKRFATQESENIGTAFIMQAQRWLRNKRWLDYPLEVQLTDSPSDPPSQVFVREDSKQWVEWQRFMVRTKGRGTPCVNFGWWFPTEWPPSS